MVEVLIGSYVKLIIKYVLFILRRLGDKLSCADVSNCEKKLANFDIYDFWLSHGIHGIHAILPYATEECER